MVRNHVGEADDKVVRLKARAPAPDDPTRAAYESEIDRRHTERVRYDDSIGTSIDCLGALVQADMVAYTDGEEIMHLAVAVCPDTAVAQLCRCIDACFDKHSLLLMMRDKHFDQPRDVINPLLSPLNTALIETRIDECIAYARGLLHACLAPYVHVVDLVTVIVDYL
jgi:hypothetical protein